MSTALRNLRRTMPYLTPPFTGEEDDIDKIWRLGALTRQLPPVTPIDTTLSDSDARIPPLNIATERVPLDPAPMPKFAAPPPMALVRSGQPVTIAAEGDDLNRAMLKRRALEEYQPQKESKKHLALRTILNFVAGGIPGAANTLIGQGGVMDRRGLDRSWQQGQLAQTDEQLGRLRTDRRAGLQDRLLESQVFENEAQAERARREPAVKDVEVGGYLLRPNPTTGKYDTVFAPPSKPADLFAGAQDVEDDQGNVILVGPDGKSIINPTTGQPFVRRRLKPPAVKPDTSSSQRDALLGNIAAAENEKKTLGAVPSPTYKEPWGEVKVNPAYTDWAARYRKLDDDIRKWKADLGKVPAVSATPALRPAVTEQTIRDAAKAKGLDAEQAVKRARARGMIR